MPPLLPIETEFSKDVLTVTSPGPDYGGDDGGGSHTADAKESDWGWNWGWFEEW